MACRPYNTGRCLLLRLFNPSKLWGSLQIWSPFLHQFWGSWSLFYAQGKSEKYYHVLFQTIAVPLHPKNSGSLRLTHGCKKIEKQGMTPT